MINIKGQGFGILCLHGHPGNGDCMSVFSNHLSSRYQMIIPDLRGYGNNKTNQDFQMSDHIDDLKEILDRYNIEQCFILGWSLGGILAMELALKVPDRVKGLILIATSARPRSNLPSYTISDYIYTLIATIFNLINPGWEWNINNFGRYSIYRFLIKRHHSRTYKYLANEGTKAFFQTSLKAHLALLKARNNGYNKLNEIKQILCPVLMLGAKGDRHITWESSLRTIEQFSQVKWRCYEDAAHLFPWEIPEEVLGEIDDWLMEIS